MRRQVRANIFEMPRSVGVIRRAAYSFGRRNRRRKLTVLLAFAAHQRVVSVLCVGVNAKPGVVGNIIERGLEQSGLSVTMSGLSEDVPGWRNYVRADGLALPFAPGEFDLVFSNAVIEHVGNEEEQRQFLAEHARVGKHWMATTPNRLFPIEAHTHTLFRHCSRRWRDPRPRGGVTRLLSRADLRAIMPSAGHIVGWVGPTLTVHSERSAPR